MHVFSDPNNFDVYVTGFLWILKLTLAGSVGAFVLGVVLAGMRVSPVPVLRGFGTLWVNTFRNTPLTLIVFFCYFGLYSTLGLTLSDDIDLNNYWLGVVGLSVYTAAFVCEAIRSGINTVPTGQAEAARAIGLTFTQNLRIIVLPQAFRAVIAPLASVLIALTKNTTIASSIGVAEAALLMSTMVENESNALISVFVVFALGFLVLTLPLGLLLGVVAKRMAVRR